MQSKGEFRIASYVYRGDGKRAWKELANGQRAYFYYAGEKLIASTNGVDVSSLQLWGADGLIGARTTNSTTGVTTKSYNLYDTQGNLAQIINARNGVILGKSAVSAWGEPIRDSAGNAAGAGYGAKFGYVRDGESGFYLCTLRYYDASGGRWLTRDPIGYAGGSNLYGYVGNDPVNATDPSGLAKVELYFKPTGIGNTVHAYLRIWEKGGKTSYVVHGFPERGGLLNTLSMSTIESATRETLRKKFFLPVPSIKSDCGRLRGYIHHWDDPMNWDKSPAPIPQMKVIASDSSKTARDYLNIMWPQIVKINNANIPYDPLTTNSNSFISDILEASGLSPAAKTKEGGRAVAWENSLFPQIS